MPWLPGWILVIPILTFLVFVHELGHYTIARFFKTTVTDFSIGFGKVLFQFKDKYLTTWKISLIPLGGYVKIKGLESIFRNQINKIHEKVLKLLKKNKMQRLDYAH